MAPPSQINLLCLAPNVMGEGRRERGEGQGAPFPLSKHFFFYVKAKNKILACE